MMTNIPSPHPNSLLIIELPRIDLGSDYSSATLKSKACKAVAYEAHFWGSASGTHFSIVRWRLDEAASPRDGVSGLGGLWRL